MGGVAGFWGGVFSMGSIYLMLVFAKRVFNPEEADEKGGDWGEDTEGTKVWSKISDIGPARFLHSFNSLLKWLELGTWGYLQFLNNHKCYFLEHYIK